ncbi:MAG: hypothetical protein AAF456_24910 [Planctomycetota bacterium]
MIARLAVLSIALIGLTSCSFAQDPATRHELGWRLRRFEAELEEDLSEDRLKRAVRPMTSAVEAFFSQNWDQAQEQLSEAYVQVAGFSDKEIAREAAELTIVIDKVVVPDTTESLSVSIRAPFHDQTAFPFSDELATGQIVTEITNADGNEIATVSAGDFLEPILIPLGPEFLPGDYSLVVKYVFLESADDNSQSMPLASRTISIIHRLNERLDELEDALAAVEEAGAERSATLTARGYVRLVQRLQRGAPAEADFSSSRYIELAETIVSSLNENKDNWLGDLPSGEYRLKLVNDEGTATVRLNVPHYEPSQKLPVLFALHGAGGSENFFFDGYGDGKVVDLCNQRNWIIVSPRLTFDGTGIDIDGILEELGKLFPVDTDRVMLAGHSMGAMNILAQVNSTETPYVAAALMGGGFAIPESDRTASVPMFIATGQYDFAASGCRALVDALNEHGYENEFKEYPFVEHMTIVQVALNDAFKFFDEKIRVVEQ